ncbi:thioredoxin family protein [Heyndrickxia ginsengihumi]|uniref:Thioredoxin n=1 Tax=Heyndrickxia ginsengihumi TaxID=363870 RepID=A0A0A6V9R6_9BACI|nr:thioredoxin family protein [Heyndrickxia ginsengihumi]KHD84955.1 thioredoxin [Heyndrickxia ginsengihumi]MBE6183009.1 thioredoxin family protein [Bacillus sp. (in: firmicutes)]MCM3023291.1 thioredoxin family protein [Heyndrickxia ginsengihumi]NEY19263.1 thioredoxin family protein [Heyndrickxia ginsengihumi]
MNDWTEEAILDRIQKEDKVALYFYTPLCGTCQVAGKMIEITEAIIKDFHYAKANLNYVPKMAEVFQIESVPCLLLFKRGILLEKIYAFQSVPFLVEALKNV